MFATFMKMFARLRSCRARALRNCSNREALKTVSDKKRGKQPGTKQQSRPHNVHVSTRQKDDRSATSEPTIGYASSEERPPKGKTRQPQRKNGKICVQEAKHTIHLCANSADSACSNKASVWVGPLLPAQKKKFNVILLHKKSSSASQSNFRQPSTKTAESASRYMTACRNPPAASPQSCRQRRSVAGWAPAYQQVENVGNKWDTQDGWAVCASHISGPLPKLMPADRVSSATGTGQVDKGSHLGRNARSS